MALRDQEGARGVRRGRQSLSSPGSGDSRWEVNLANTLETGRHTPINASFAGDHRKMGDRRGVSVCSAAQKRAMCEVVFGVMFIFMYYKTNMDPSKIYGQA